jgi:hypothetical protein
MQHARLLAAVVLATLGTTVIACDDDDLFDIDDEATYTAALTPVLVTNPPADPTTTAAATLELDEGDFHVVINVTGPLTGSVTGAQILGPSVGGTAAPVVFDFTPRMASAINSGATTGNVLNAEYDLEDMTPSANGELRINPHTLIDMLNNGSAVIVVTTANNPTAELAGQVVRR